MIRKGREVGKTPIVLNRMPVGESAIGLRLDGFASTNFPILRLEGSTTNYTIKLFSVQYLYAVKEAREALDANELEQAGKFIKIAHGEEPDDTSVIALSNELARKSEARKQKELEVARKAAEERVRALAKAFADLPVLVPEVVVRDCWNTKNEPMPSHSEARVGAAAIPVYGATEVVVTAIKIIAWPFKKLTTKKEPRFSEVRFLKNYLDRVYRFYGTIGSIDAKQNTLTFVSASEPKSDGVHVSQGTVIVPSDDTAKLSCAVTARLHDSISSAALALRPGAAVWVTGQLTAIEEAGRTFPASNRLILDNSIVYPPEILPANK